MIHRRFNIGIGEPQTSVIIRNLFDANANSKFDLFADKLYIKQS